MAFPSQSDPTKKFGSRFRQRKFDEAHSKDTAITKPAESPAHEAAETPEFEAGEKEGQKEMTGEQHPVVAQHGKAVKTTVKHDHVANKHHVTSQHEDGHINESDHATAQEAHDESAKLAGVEPSPEGQEQPGADESQLGSVFGGSTETQPARSLPRMA